jgi:hypothetical protein
MDEQEHVADPLAFTDAIAQVPAGGAPYVAAEALLARLSSEEKLSLLDAARPSGPACR